MRELYEKKVITVVKKMRDGKATEVNEFQQRYGSMVERRYESGCGGCATKYRGVRDGFGSRTKGL